MLGHRTSSQKPLSVPTTDAERTRLRQRRYTLGQYMEERADTLNRHFDYVSPTHLLIKLTEDVEYLSART